MPRAVVDPGPVLETLPSHSDPAIPLVSIHSPVQRPLPDPEDPSATDAVPTAPRPRPSLQIYYAPTRPPPPTTTTTTTTTTTEQELATVARTLETVVLKNRFATSGANYERLDVYAVPIDDEAAPAAVAKDGRFAALADADVVVQRCVAHQRAEIAARDRDGGKEWYIQRYDGFGGREWRRSIIVIRTPVAEWNWGAKAEPTGLVLSTVAFDPTSNNGPEVVVFTGSTEGEIHVLIHELRHELNWQHSFVQFLD